MDRTRTKLRNKTGGFGFSAAVRQVIGAVGRVDTPQKKSTGLREGSRRSNSDQRGILPILL